MALLKYEAGRVNNYQGAVLVIKSRGLEATQ